MNIAIHQSQALRGSKLHVLYTLSVASRIAGHLAAEYPRRNITTTNVRNSQSRTLPLSKNGPAISPVAF